MGKAVESPRPVRRALAVVASLAISCSWHDSSRAAPAGSIDAAPPPPASSHPDGRPPPDAQPGSVDASAAASSIPEHEWRLVNGRSWQIAGPPGEDPAVTDAAERNRGACPVGMIEIAGKMKTGALIDELQQTACTSWISTSFPERCADFDRDKWLAISKDLPTHDMRFCMDRFEYPNRKGEYPIILINFYEAADACKAEGKRLCTENEWTFACEGEEARPYPNGTGYTRDAAACTIDKPWRAFDAAALAPRDGAAAMHELDRLWQGEASGARPECKSPFGVHDMTGNVDEWTRSSAPGRPSILKGGYWGPVRTRCRPSTRAHGETFTFYQQGLRCCADAP